MKKTSYTIPVETADKFQVGTDIMGNDALLFDGKVVAFTHSPDMPKELVERYVADLLDNHVGGSTPLDFHWVRVFNSDIPIDWYIAGSTHAIPNPEYLELSELYYRAAIQEVYGTCPDHDLGSYNLTGYAMTEGAVLIAVWDDACLQWGYEEDDE